MQEALNNLNSPTVSTNEPARQQASAHKRPPSSVIVGKPLVDDLACTPHGKGPDSPMAALRALVWIELERANRFARAVHAHPRRIAQAFDGKRPGGMVRHGMSERALTRLWGRISSYLEREDDGRVRLRRYREFYAFTVEQATELVYGMAAPDLRALAGMWAPIVATDRAGFDQVNARSRACCRRTGQSRSRWCQRVRALALRGWVADNAPGRKTVRGKPDRRPHRTINVHATRMSPLRRAQIRWSGGPKAVERPQETGQIGPVEKSPRGFKPCKEFQDARECPSEALSSSPEISIRPATQPASGGELAELRAQPAEPAELVGTGLAVALATVIVACSQPPASPPSAPAGASACSDAQRLRRCDTRRILADAGLDTRRAMPRDLDAIGDACDTAGVLRRLLRDEADVLVTRCHPIRWLAVVCEAEGAAVRDPAWPGSHKSRLDAAKFQADRVRRGLEPYRAPESPAEAASRMAIRDAGEDPSALRAAAAALAATGEREGKPALSRAAESVREHAERCELGRERQRQVDQIWSDAERVTARWSTWSSAIELARVSEWERRNELAGARVVRHAPGAVELTTPDESSAQWLIDSGLAGHVATALCRLDPAPGRWTVTMLDPAGRALGSVSRDADRSTESNQNGAAADGPGIRDDGRARRDDDAERAAAAGQAAGRVVAAHRPGDGRPGPGVDSVSPGVVSQGLPQRHGGTADESRTRRWSAGHRAAAPDAADGRSTGTGDCDAAPQSRAGASRADSDGTGGGRAGRELESSGAILAGQDAELSRSSVGEQRQDVNDDARRWLARQMMNGSARAARILAMLERKDR